MIMKLEFGPDEACAAANAVNGTAWRTALETVDNELRQILKYGDLPKEVARQLDDVRFSINDAVEAEGLTLHDNVRTVANVKYCIRLRRWMARIWAAIRSF